MATCHSEAREWARSALRGIGNSLYTPFCGDRRRRHRLGRVPDAGALLRRRTRAPDAVVHQRHRRVLVADDRRAKAAAGGRDRGRARAANPDVVVQACTAAMSAKDCLELTRHAQQAGADIVYIQTPMMEAHGGEGVLRFFRYIADRTDIALGMFNSPSSGYVLTPAESARIYAEIPAVCATKEGAFRPASSRLLHELAPDLVIWECDLTVYRAGWLRAGIVGPAQLGTAGYLYETPQQPIISEYWELIWDGKLDRGDGLRREVRAGPVRHRHGRRGSPATRVGPTTSRTGAGRSSTRRRCSVCRSATTRTRGRRRRSLPDEGKAQIDAAYQRFGLVDAHEPPQRLRKALPIGVQYVHTSSWSRIRRSAAVSCRSDPVLYEVRDSGVAVLTLNRPERMNGWGGGLAAKFYALLDQAEADPDVRAIVVTGAGGRSVPARTWGICHRSRAPTPRRETDMSQAGRRTASAFRRRRCESPSSPRSTGPARASG